MWPRRFFFLCSPPPDFFPFYLPGEWLSPWSLHGRKLFLAMEMPREATAGSWPPVSQEECCHQKTPSLQNCQDIHFCCSGPPVYGVRYGSLSYNSSTEGMFSWAFCCVHVSQSLFPVAGVNMSYVRSSVSSACSPTVLIGWFLRYLPKTQGAVCSSQSLPPEYS